MITDILKYRIAAINKEYKRLHNQIREKEQKVRYLVMEQLALETEIAELDRKLEELELQVIKDIEDATNGR